MYISSSRDGKEKHRPLARPCATPYLDNAILSNTLLVFVKTCVRHKKRTSSLPWCIFIRHEVHLPCQCWKNWRRERLRDSQKPEIGDDPYAWWYDVDMRIRGIAETIRNAFAPRDYIRWQLYLVEGTPPDGGGGNPECYRERGHTHTQRGHTPGGNIYRAELPRMEGMNLRRDVRARMQRRRRGVHGNPEPRPECPHPISILFEGWERVYSWPAARSTATTIDGRSRGVIARLSFRLLRRLPCFPASRSPCRGPPRADSIFARCDRSSPPASRSDDRCTLEHLTGE